MSALRRSTLGASGFTRFWNKVYGPSLDDARNAAALEQLAASVGAVARTLHDMPEVLTGMRLYERELIAYARWFERLEGGRRAFVFTNSGVASRSSPYTIMPCQVVAVVMPNAPVNHPLTLLKLPSFSILYPHLALAVQTPAEDAAQSADHLWTLNGYALPMLQGRHGYRFGGCLDGVLYATTTAPSFDPRAAMAALEELSMLAAGPWQPPLPGAALVAASAGSAAAARIMNRNLIVAASVFAGLILLGLLASMIDVLRRILP
jgi:hypothetical protein